MTQSTEAVPWFNPVIRETFFVNCFKNIYYSDIGDFIVDNNIFEVGGKNKSFSQVKDLENAYLAIDIDFTLNDKKIPLWLFSFINKGSEFRNHR